MALHNSGIGVWRHDNSPWRARCHVSIRQSPSLCNAILNTCPCLLAIPPPPDYLTFCRDTVMVRSLRWLLGAVQAPSHYLYQRWLVCRRIYVSLGLYEIKHCFLRNAVGIWNAYFQNMFLWLVSNPVSHWLRADLESALYTHMFTWTLFHQKQICEMRHIGSGNGLMPDGRYMSQGWLIISEVLRYSLEDNLTGNGHRIYPWYENCQIKITTAFPNDHTTAGPLQYKLNLLETQIK